MNCEVSIIPHRMVAITLPDVYDYLEQAVARSGGRDTMFELLKRLHDNKNQLWIAFTTDPADKGETVVGAVVTTIPKYENRKVFRVEYCGGKHIESWVYTMLDMLEAFAQDHGLDTMEFVGRKGWVKFLKDAGWTEPLGFFEKTLNSAAAKDAA